MKNTMTVREAAQRMGCTLKYVYDLLYAGKLPSHKVGRQWRIPASAIETRLKNREVRNG
jgi:excisionase family DNA binding protein